MACLAHEGHGFQRQVRRHGEALEIHDTEDGSQPFSVCWIMPPGTNVKPLPEGADARFQLERGSHRWLLTLRAAGQASITMEERRVSPAYGRLETAPAIVVSGIQPALITTLERVGG